MTIVLCPEIKPTKLKMLLGGLSRFTFLVYSLHKHMYIYTFYIYIHVCTA